MPVGNRIPFAVQSDAGTLTMDAKSLYYDARQCILVACLVFVLLDRHTAAREEFVVSPRRHDPRQERRACRDRIVTLGTGDRSQIEVGSDILSRATSGLHP